MKKFIMGMTAAVVALGLSINAAPAHSSPPDEPLVCAVDRPTIKISDTTLPSSGYKSLAGGWCSGQNDGGPFEATFIAPSGAERVLGVGDENNGWLVAGDETGTWSVYLQSKSTGKTSVLDTFTVGAATAPTPSPVTTGGGTASSNGKCATRKEFRKIKPGMTLTKVKSIVGSKGRLTMSSSHLKIRQWDTCSNPYGVMTIGFTGRGRVQSKSYIA